MLSFSSWRIIIHGAGHEPVEGLGAAEAARGGGGGPVVGHGPLARDGHEVPAVGLAVAPQDEEAGVLGTEEF